jgi:Asp-tRNA(Asn)/Glu-tRNA(Gln) amidotransferase A subunit family amidase
VNGTTAELVVGLMLIGRHGDDTRVLAVAQAIEALPAPPRR